jgi:L-fuculose-phosphate aldolase
MTPDILRTDLNGKKLSGDRDRRRSPHASQKCAAAGRPAPWCARIRRSRPVLPWPASLDRAVLAEVLTTLGSIPLAEYATPSTSELPEAIRKYIKAHDGMLLANHGALTVGTDLFSAYYKMETIEHFAHISLVARMLGRENLISREEVMRLQELRGTYGIKAPAPICADPVDDPTCQTVQAPQGDGQRLIPDVIARSTGRVPPSDDAEIRLTYRELSALIEDAIRSLK